MTPQIKRLLSARHDVGNIAFDLAAQSGNRDLGRRFIRSVEKTYKLLAKMPFLGCAREFENPIFSGLRSFQVKDFTRYLVFYKPLTAEKGIEVYRVIYSGRDLEQIFK